MTQGLVKDRQESTQISNKQTEKTPTQPLGKLQKVEVASSNWAQAGLGSAGAQQHPGARQGQDRPFAPCLLPAQPGEGQRGDGGEEGDAGQIMVWSELCGV